MLSIPTAGSALTLPGGVRAPARARAFLAHAPCTPHHAGVLYRAQLLVSELVTNAVRHGAPPVTVEVECDTTAQIVVRVHDEGPEHPRLVRAGTHDDGGHGIALLDRLSDAWGIEATEHGKAVWFHLGPTPRS